MLYVRKAEKCPEKLVKNGKCVFGGYDGHPERLDIRGLSRVFLDLPIPEFLTNLHINSRLTFFFSIGEYIGSIDFFDAKIFGLVQVVFWNVATKQRFSYRSVMGPRRRLVPHSLVKAATSSYKKSRYVRISWDRTLSKLSAIFHLKGDSVRPSAEGAIKAVLQEISDEEATLVLPAPTLRRGSARYNTVLPIHGAISLVESNHEKKLMDDADGIAFLDMNRTYMKFINRTEFLTGLGFIGEKRVAFRIEAGSQDAVDPDKYNGNIFFYDGKKTLLPPVVITHTYGIMKTWNIQDTENMIDLTFSPISDHRSYINTGAFKMDYHTIYGTFSGVLMTGEGEKININSIPGLTKTNLIRI
ncbi:MAG: DUF2804 family protein [Treponema sp.]|nr:DUF2804 family protein [Treponema sp.]